MKYFLFLLLVSGFVYAQDPIHRSPITGRIQETSSAPLCNTLYVDSNATVDSNQEGSTEHPCATIQAAIDIATEGDCIRVRLGLYPETIDFLGKNLTVTSMDPCDPTRIEFPVIQGGVHDVAVQFTHGEDPNCKLEGFVISGGRGALLCDRSSPTITHCLIIGNQSTDPNQATITCRESQAWFDHCTITDNRGTGLLLSNSDIIVSNSIVWGNLPDDMILNGTSEPRILYSNLTHPWEDLGNITVPPLFARPGQWESDPNDYWIPGDYHLQSAAGRWDPTTTQWQLDADTSPCIDAGDPNSPWFQETEPHGDWANIGVYGNTAQASHSPALVYTDDPIEFVDQNLKTAIEDQLQVYDPTPFDMLTLFELISIQGVSTQVPRIADLEGLEFATNLQHLNLRYNLIHDITSLSGLTQLNHLNLSQNRLTDIFALSQMTALDYLNVHANFINDISPLQNLSTLTRLDLHENPLENISPLINLTQLTSLILYSCQVSELSPLAPLTKLKTLHLSYNEVDNLSPLENLSRLTHLSLYTNKLQDITIVANLTKLTQLNVGRNKLVDISPLAHHPSLTSLYLKKNKISDISVLMTLDQLVTLELTENPLNDQAYQVYLDAIVDANPRVTLKYDPCTQPPSHLSATQGLYPDRVDINWGTVYNGPHYTSHYRVSRSTTEAGIKIPISPWQTDTSFIDITTGSGVHTYWVQTATAPDGDETASYSDPTTGWLQN